MRYGLSLKASAFVSRYQDTDILLRHISLWVRVGANEYGTIATPLQRSHNNETIPLGPGTGATSNGTIKSQRLLRPRCDQRARQNSCLVFCQIWTFFAMLEGCLPFLMLYFWWLSCCLTLNEEIGVDQFLYAERAKLFPFHQIFDFHRMQDLKTPTTLPRMMCQTRRLLRNRLCTTIHICLGNPLNQNHHVLPTITAPSPTHLKRRLSPSLGLRTKFSGTRHQDPESRGHSGHNDHYRCF